MNELYFELRKVLKNLKIYPINNRYWYHFNIDHKKIKILNKKKLKDKRNEISDKLKINSKNKIKGIYIYKTNRILNNQYLYIGKSKDIKSRLYHHFKESQDLTGSKDWRKFFQKYNKKLEVYCLEVDHKDPKIGETLRIFVERFLITKYKPKFEEKHPTKK